MSLVHDQTHLNFLVVCGNKFLICNISHDLGQLVMCFWRKNMDSMQSLWLQDIVKLWHFHRLLMSQGADWKLLFENGNNSLTWRLNVKDVSAVYAFSDVTINRYFVLEAMNYLLYHNNLCQKAHILGKRKKCIWLRSR